MAKSKDRSELEFLRAENRKMKAIIRHLKKESSRLGKREYIFDEMEQEVKEHLLTEEKEAELATHSNNCPNCIKGSLEFNSIGIRMLITCNSCNYRCSKKTVK